LALLNIFHQLGPEFTPDPVAVIFTFDSSISSPVTLYRLQNRGGLGLATP
jgi:hypothetical protein